MLFKFNIMFGVRKLNVAAELANHIFMSKTEIKYICNGCQLGRELGIG